MLEARGGTDGARSQGGEFRIRQAHDGHFWVDGELNGAPVRFLVDSGATVTSAVARATAERAGVARERRLRHDGRRPPTASSWSTAAAPSGSRSARSSAATLPSTSPTAFGDINVIGMNFLSTLARLGRRGDGRWCCSP